MQDAAAWQDMQGYGEHAGACSPTHDGEEDDPRAAQIRARYVYMHCTCTFHYTRACDGDKLGLKDDPRAAQIQARYVDMHGTCTFHYTCACDGDKLGLKDDPRAAQIRARYVNMHGTCMLSYTYPSSPDDDGGKHNLCQAQRWCTRKRAQMRMSTCRRIKRYILARIQDQLTLAFPDPSHARAQYSYAHIHLSPF